MSSTDDEETLVATASLLFPGRRFLSGRYCGVVKPSLTLNDS